ncbi:MAG: sigma-54-dependent Fis family transcriptional regulator [Gammaproteobacteria bacterium]|nr:MAG: sigma-54-dependent Fis family transcriptional regulator [Gammaproteobacteria bacterium]
MNQATFRDDARVSTHHDVYPACNSILVVEDDPSLREILGKTLSMDDFNVVLAESAEQALSILRTNFRIALVLSDVQMQPMSGHTLLKKCKELYPQLPVILMTAYGTIGNAVNAIHDGAADYLVKPFEHDELIKMIKRYLVQKTIVIHADVINAQGEVSIENKTNDNEEQSIHGLIAVDKKSIQLSQVAKKVAKTDVTVMISGESGVGKEVISKFIHKNSARFDGPFIAINCAAIPENMLEAVLFGYEKGAYTGAYQSRAGKFEQAQGGTLLLDEVTEMDLGLQVKLLRVLQEREVERLGGSKVIPLDVRILATTNRNLQQAVIDGKFREDLYYRINVFPLHITPLRERTGDILPIANKMLDAYSDDIDNVFFSLTAQRALKMHDWPGNIRELDNVIQRALILKTGSLIEECDVQFEHINNNVYHLENVTEGFSEDDSKANDSGLNNDLKAREQDLIISALSTRDSRKKVAEKLGISPRTLRYKLARMRNAGIPLPV